MNEEGTGSTREQHLPPAEELLRLRSLPKDQRPTLAAIGQRYGVSRQAVFKRLDKWRREQKRAEEESNKTESTDQEGDK